MAVHFTIRSQRPLVALLLVSFLSACGSPTVEHDLVLRDVTVVDVETGTLSPNSIIAVDDSLIAFVGADGEGSHRGRAEVDGAGSYAIPGRWDMHVHIEGADLVEDNLLLFPVYYHGLQKGARRGGRASGLEQRRSAQQGIQTYLLLGQTPDA